MELSETRLRRDEIELYYYGFSSTQLYLNYRECVDNRLKLLMLEVAKFYEVIQPEDVDETNDILLEQYKTFWAIAEPSFQNFYEDIQEIFSLPGDYGSNDCEDPNNMFFNRDVKCIEKEIDYLEDEYMVGKFYLKSLQHCIGVIENKCIPLQNKVIYASKLLKEYREKLDKHNILNSKRKELVGVLEKEKKTNLIDVAFSFAKDSSGENILDMFKKQINENAN